MPVRQIGSCAEADEAFKFTGRHRGSVPLKTTIASLAVIAALAAAAAHAGSLAPAPRVIAKYERSFIERSGAQTLEELLDTGIVRYFLTGGQPLLVLVNGRPYATTSSDLDTLPLSAIERLELLSGETLGTLGGSAVRGALNVVLRNDLDGFETRAVARLPTRSGGAGWQGSAFWGVAVGNGRVTLGVDVLRREEIASKIRSRTPTTICEPSRTRACGWRTISARNTREPGWPWRGPEPRTAAAIWHGPRGSSWSA